VSILLDTYLLSLLERKRIPAKLAAWIAEQNDRVVSVVSLAELEFGLQQAPVPIAQLLPTGLPRRGGALHRRPRS
jgi:predicted nucleic acid-binding protein